MREVSTKDVREGFSEIVNRVGFGGERVVLVRRGKRVAALVPLADLERLERERAAVTAPNCRRPVRSQS